MLNSVSHIYDLLSTVVSEGINLIFYLIKYSVGLSTTIDYAFQNYFLHLVFADFEDIHYVIFGSVKHVVKVSQIEVVNYRVQANLFPWLLDILDV